MQSGEHFLVYARVVFMSTVYLIYLGLYAINTIQLLYNTMLTIEICPVGQKFRPRVKTEHAVKYKKEII